MSKSILTAFAIAALAATVGLVLDGAGVFSGASKAFAGWIGSSWFVGGGAVSVPALGVLATLLASLFAAWVASSAVRLREVVWIPLVTGLLVFSGAVVLAGLGVLVSPFSAMVACLMVGVIGVVAGLRKSGRRGQAARGLLAGRAASASLAAAANADSGIESPVRREVTLVTVRLLGVDDLVGGLDPRAVSEVSEAIDAAVRQKFFEAGAVIDRSAPDCIYAIFGAFAGDAAAEAKLAIGAALEIRDRLRLVTMELTEKLREEVRVGISVETGTAVVGVFKAAGASDAFGMVGAVADVGRRLAGANAIYGSRILLGTRAHQLAGDSAAVRPMEMLSDAHSGSLSEVYEVLAPAGELGDEAEERREVFWEAVVLFREGKWKDSLAHFERARSGEVTDSPLEYFIGLARQAYAGDSPNQPKSKLSKEAVQKQSHARSSRTL